MFGKILTDNNSMMPICEICNVFVDGDWIESKDQDDTGIRLIQTGNIGNGQYLDKGERARFINRDTFTRLKCKRVLENDILISRLPDPIGRACIIPDIGDAITGVDCTIVRLKSVCNPLYFISYTMQRQYSEQIKTYETGSTRKRISRNNLGKILIPLPPIELQNQFADFVKQVDKSKLVFRAMVSKLDELVNNRFNEMFGVHSEYDKSPLSALLKQYYIPEKIDNPQLESYITLSSHGKGVKKRIIPEGKTPVPFTGCRIKTGQFISSRLHAKEGAFGIIPSELSGSVVSKDFPVFDINTNAILPEYLITCVCQKSFYSQFMNYSYGSTTKRRIKEDVFLDFVIPLPPLNKQQEFVLFQKQVDKLKFQQAS